MYQVYRVPVDGAAISAYMASDEVNLRAADPDEWADPPKGGEALPKRFNSFLAACNEAEMVMAREHNPAFAYFVVPGGYSCGYIAEPDRDEHAEQMNTLAVLGELRDGWYHGQRLNV